MTAAAAVCRTEECSILSGVGNGLVGDIYGLEVVVKSFYEMMMILESQGYADADAVLALMGQAFKKASLPWDQDEFNVLYGKWADMTVGLAPNRTERV